MLAEKVFGDVVLAEEWAVVLEEKNESWSGGGHARR